MGRINWKKIRQIKWDAPEGERLVKGLLAGLFIRAGYPFESINPAYARFALSSRPGWLYTRLGAPLLGVYFKCRPHLGICWDSGDLWEVSPEYMLFLSATGGWHYLVKFFKLFSFAFRFYPDRGHYSSGPALKLFEAELRAVFNKRVSVEKVVFDINCRYKIDIDDGPTIFLSPPLFKPDNRLIYSRLVALEAKLLARYTAYEFLLL